ncbi:hypothetical protein [Microbulbifer aggregans]|uniref:hypothetical protein n=1 Tax=Microbulbifer aggregans TaxID=1769779 RepID=UPI001CFC98C9|nr:hypothetical protein [Microbulbifer aggregans]
MQKNMANDKHLDQLIFSFEEQRLQVPYFEGMRVLAAASCTTDPKNIFILTDRSELICLDLYTGDLSLVKELNGDEFPVNSEFQLYCSQDGRFLAVTCRRQQSHEHSAICRGVVVRIGDSKEILSLSAGEYHTELTPLPVCFIAHNSKTHLVHATDWNRLDITDLETGEIITGRDLTESPRENEDNDYVFKEWSGVLKASPSQTRLATIGWVWHPIGVALSYDLKSWLNGDLWETDSSPNMRSYAIWDYFWDSPFCWINDQKICIWGVDDGQFGDAPTNTAAVFDVESEELLLSISGPTSDIFFFDKYLFSGLYHEEKEPAGITIWSIDDGSLLYKKEGVFCDLYVPEEKALIAFGCQGLITINRWRSHP